MEEKVNPIQEPEENKTAATPKKKNKMLYLVIGLAAVLVLLLLAAFVILPMMNAEEPAPTVPTEAPTTETTAPPTTEPTETTEPPTTLPPDENLEKLEAVYAQNPETYAWLQIDNTVIDYPVMYTPDDGEKYIYADVNGKLDFAGTLFIDARCEMEPRCDNVLVHGHNMKEGTMFAILPHYETEDFWKEHSNIRFTTLKDGTKEYEVFAAFYDRVYMKTDTCFKYYNFINAKDEADFNNAMAEFKAKRLYDTGVDPQFGDKLITLSTCTYHVEEGRFVLVLREKTA